MEAMYQAELTEVARRKVSRREHLRRRRNRLRREEREELESLEREERESQTGEAAPTTANPVA